MADWRNKAGRWKSGLMKRYGMTVHEYRNMETQQGKVCALCESPPKEGKVLCVDHCHQTGGIRGLLCHKCNISLGRYEAKGEATNPKYEEYLDAGFWKYIPNFVPPSPDLCVAS